MIPTTAFIDSLESQTWRIPFCTCWYWLGSQDRHGYGQKWFNGKNHILSRLVLAHKLGRELGAEVARHTCDTPDCINPAHLVPGTRSQNQRDAVQRGRQKTGGAAPHALFHVVQRSKMRELVASGRTINSVAEEFATSWDTVKKIVGEEK